VLHAVFWVKCCHLYLLLVKLFGFCIKPSWCLILSPISVALTSNCTLTFCHPVPLLFLSTSSSQNLCPSSTLSPIWEGFFLLKIFLYFHNNLSGNTWHGKLNPCKTISSLVLNSKSLAFLNIGNPSFRACYLISHFPYHLSENL